MHDTGGKKIEFIPYSLRNNALYSKGCITCGERNIIVKFYLDRHICLACRKLIKTYDGDRVFIFLNEMDEIEVWAYTFNEKREKVWYECDPTRMLIKGYRCYASYAGETELVVLLHDDQKDFKQWQLDQIKKGNVKRKKTITKL